MSIYAILVYASIPTAIVIFIFLMGFLKPTKSWMVRLLRVLGSLVVAVPLPFCAFFYGYLTVFIYPLCLILSLIFFVPARILQRQDDLEDLLDEQRAMLIAIGKRQQQTPQQADHLLQTRPLQQRPPVQS